MNRFSRAAIVAVVLMAARCGGDEGNEEVGSLTAAATVPSGFTDVLVASGLSNPTAMDIAPDGRIFVAEQGGKLRVIKNGSLLGSSFLQVPVMQDGERGLLGVAVDPSFGSNGWVYVYYTVGGGSKNRVSRFTANGDVSTGAETIILDNIPSISGYHNGGAIHFGADGKLYIGVGEGHTPSNAQSMSTLAGKLLRINSDGSIPSDNPFFGSASGVNRAIWALGLRNPFSFAVQPGSGRIFINDVGQNTWEEINDGGAGFNFGWPGTEGPDNNPAFKTPFHAYDHGSGCAITGGSFYNPQSAGFPSQYVGDYFFSDFCGAWIKAIDVSTKQVTTFATGISNPVDLKVGSDGSLYYLAFTEGAVHRVRYQPSGGSYTVTADTSSVPTGGALSVSWTAPSGRPPTDWVSLYRVGDPNSAYGWWQYTDGATSGTFNLSAPSLAGQYEFRYLLENGLTHVATSGAIDVTGGGNTAPFAAITQPASGTTYQAGQTVSYAGTGTDPQDGTLPPGAFTWKVDFHHDAHSHPFVPATSGATSGSFTVPTTGETSDSVWYRIHLTVTDSGGLTHSVQRDVLPKKATVTLATNPSGLQVKLDGQPRTAPSPFVGVVGMVRSIEAVSPQSAGGKTYAFQSWSDGGAAVHNITTPASNTTFTANFVETGASPYGVAASTSSVNPGGALGVSWTAPAGRPPTDWVSLFRVGDPNTAFGWWQYTGGATSGSLSLSAPTALGQYEFRYLLEDGFTDAAKSGVVTVGSAPQFAVTASTSAVQVGGALSVSFTAPPGRPATDWVAIFEPGDPNTSFGWWQYTGGTSSGTFALTAPSQAGAYEFRYLLQDGFTDAAKSGVVNVTP